MMTRSANVIKYTPGEDPTFFFDEEVISVPGQPEKYDFSVVVAAYNSENFIKETIDSVINQDFGFEKIQLILVNDGSTDGTLAICEEYAQQYPQNIVVVDKENGGVSSARNAGMRFVKGKYINFLDSDDKFGKNVFSKVYEFYKKHGNKTDVVTIKVELFGAKKGDTWFNRKFDKGDRLIDLWKDPKVYLNAANSTFFHSRIKNQLHFDESISISEDLKMVNYVMANKWTLGVLSSCKFYYRIHNADEMSLTNSARRKPDWYFTYLEHVYFWLYEQIYARTNMFPKYLQYTLFRDLYNRFVNNTQLVDVITTDEERSRYKELLFKALRLIDDDVIKGIDCINTDYQIYFYTIKHGAPRITADGCNTKFSWRDGKVTVSKKCTIMYTDCRILDKKLLLEGYFILNNYGCEVSDYYINLNDKDIKVDIIEGTTDNSLAFWDEIIFWRKYFKVSLDLSDVKETTLRPFYQVGDTKVSIGYSGFGKWFGVDCSSPHAYYNEGGYTLAFANNFLTVRQAGFMAKVKSEWALLKYLRKGGKKNPDLKKAFLIRGLYQVKKIFKIRPLWLVSDRDVSAGDNGEAFYRYLKRKPNINKYFVMWKDIPDAKRLKRAGFKLLDPRTAKYKRKFLLADAIVTSNMDPSQISPLYCKYVRDIIQKKRFVFLQHGIIKDDLSSVYSRPSRKIDMFVTSAAPEYESIVQNPMYFCDRSVTKLTGLARYDALYNDTKKIVLVIPTWRRGLVSHVDHTCMEWVLKPDFEETYYYQFYYSLFTNERLRRTMDAAGYKLVYFPHINIIRSNSYFEGIEGLDIIDGERRNYTKLFAEADIMVTDYSSTAFDFGYLRKPIVFCQGDSEEFYASHTYTEGYFDYTRDAFGKVTTDVEDAVDAIIEIIDRGGTMDDMYLERANNFFPFSDKNNSKRIYTEIKKVVKGDLT